MAPTLPFTPLVIIGAGRSGTNALRDALVSLDDFATWPCDEINPIWRHGNFDYPNDEIPPAHATPKVSGYIRKAFVSIWKEQDRPRFVVEKTCANSLRVPFVDRVLPEARYVHIVRDGYDVAASAQKRWRGELELPGMPYFLAKARYAPITDLPRYAFSALRNRLAVRLGLQEHFDSWGPRFDGLDTIKDAPIGELVARQWAACVNASDTAFTQIPPDRVFQLRYEDFTADASGLLSAITNWLQAPVTDAAIAQAAAPIRQSSVGKGRQAMIDLPDDILALMHVPMTAHGYTALNHKVQD